MTELLSPAALNMALAEALGYPLTATTDEQIAIALDSFEWPPLGAEAWREAYRKMEAANAAGASRCDYMFLWDDRAGKSWQSDIEAHIAAWRRDPPDYAGDLAIAYSLGEEMRKRNLYTEFVDELFQRVTGTLTQICNMHAWAIGMIAHASAYDRALAALRALGGTE